MDPVSAAISRSCTTMSIDRSITSKNFWVQGGLVVERADDYDPESRWNNTELKGEVDRLGKSESLRMGSRAQVQGFIFLAISSIWFCLIPAKWSRDSKLLDSGSMLGGGRKEELDIRERMLLTLALKKSMKLLHLSSVASAGEDDCGFRR